jgi:PLP dependent protein
MPVNKEKYKEITAALGEKLTLVAVSKTKSIEDIKTLYELGQRDFGENYVQELVDKEAVLPKDIRWHFIGHLQSNKVKYIAPFIHLIQGTDSLKLLQEINKQAKKLNKVIDVLLQVHIAQEETKFGLDEKELEKIVNANARELSEFQEWSDVRSDAPSDRFDTRSDTPSDHLQHVKICGLMGMASFSDDMNKVRNEFKYLKSVFDRHRQLRTPNAELSTLSMGMSSDYTIAIEEGSNMVRIGSLLFGERNYS